MSQPILVVIILAALAGAAYLIFLHRRTSNLSTTVDRVASKLAAVPSLVADHVEAALKAKARQIVATTAEPAAAPPPAAPSPSPAAPAASVAIESPPATVVPAAPPAAPAPSAEGSGTEHTLNVGVVAERVRNQYLSLDFADKLPAGQVQLPDAEYIVKMGPAFRAALGTLPNVQLQFAILSGSQAAINGAMDHALQDIARTLKFDPATYAGPLKARYAALVEGVHSGAIKPVSLYSDTGTIS